MCVGTGLSRGGGVGGVGDQSESPRLLGWRECGIYTLGVRSSLPNPIAQCIAMMDAAGTTTTTQFFR